MHRHPSEEGTEQVIVLLILVILLSPLPILILRTRTVLFSPKAVIMRLLLGIDECRVCIGDFLEDLFGA